MINPHQFINHILEPALMATGTYSLDAMHLMVCTALVESKLTHLKQLPAGPALGLMQVEPATYLDVIRYLNRKPSLCAAILHHCERDRLPENSYVMIGDITLNVLIARIKYWMQPEAIPSYKDPEGQARYYEQYYNGNVSVDKTQEFIKYAKEIIGWIEIPAGNV